MPDTPKTESSRNSSPEPPPDSAAEPEPTAGEPDPDSPAPISPGPHADPAFPSPVTDGPAVSFHLDTADTTPPAAGWIEGYLLDALRRCGVASGGLAVTLIDDAEMTRLHAEHCDDPTTTDVLTFDLREPGQPASHLEGDLVVCRDEAERQAQARGHDARLELLLYAVHGLMHLLGEDDHDPAAYERMHQREDELLTALGLGPVFHGRGREADGAIPGDVPGVAS